MAPEQAAGAAVRSAADWYSVGVLLYQVLTGKLPFSGSAFKIYYEKQRNTPAEPRSLSPDVPADLNDLCMDLLRLEPDARPSGQDVLERTGVEVESERAAEQVLSVTTVTQTVPFVGREHELALLEQAFSDMLSRGEQLTTFIQGDSGVGKTELIRYFTETVVAQRDDAVVLRGRCYERESVPFKALDGIVDALSRYMRRIPTLEAATLVPRGAALLPRVFPVLGRVEAITMAARMHRRISDPRELRRRVFAAVRELFYLLGEQHPLVLVIDDFQWSDADSLLLLGELLRPPEAPRLLLLLSSRAPLPRDSERGNEAAIPGDVRMIELGPLEPHTAQRLARVLLSHVDKDRIVSAAGIASEARGHPLYIYELVRYATITDAPDRARPRLEDAIWTRVTQLDAPGRELLELVCAASVPLPARIIGDAARIDAAELARQIGLLRVAHLVRSSGGRGSEVLEPYHNHVRDAVMTRLDEGARRGRHQRLALALESAGLAAERPQLLLRHLEAAGQIEKASELAEESAQRATRALAFDRAAELLRTALRLGTYGADEVRALRMELGDALANAGRCVDAAQSYLEAAVGADPATRLECQRRAAQQFLISGHIERGLDTLRDVLHDIGVSVAPTPRRALAAFLWQRVKLRVRGLGWKERHASQVTPEALKQLDVFDTVATGLATVDTIRGADFQSRRLLLALRTGERTRLAIAMLHESVNIGALGSRNLKRAATLIREARRVASSTDDPYVTAWLITAESFHNYFCGRFKAAATRFAEAAREFREHTVGSVWELNNVRLFQLLALRHLGAFAQISPLLDDFVRDAAQRGDRFLETSLRRTNTILWLARGRPDAAREELARALWTPPEHTFHVQHWYELEALSELALYEGTASAALEELEPSYRRLARSLLLRVQIIRAHANWLRARTQLSALSDGAGDRERRLAEAGRLARRLRRESVQFPHPWSHLVLGAVALQRGDTARACAELRRAAETATEQGMELEMAAARRRLGTIVGGTEGAVLIARAEEWLAGEGIVAPDRMLEIVAPGFTLADAEGGGAA